MNGPTICRPSEGSTRRTTKPPRSRSREPMTCEIAMSRPPEYCLGGHYDKANPPRRGLRWRRAGAPARRIRIVKSAVVEHDTDRVRHGVPGLVDVVNGAQLQALGIRLVFLARDIPLGLVEQLQRLVKAAVADHVRIHRHVLLNILAVHDR